jgi:hypothetical protein
MTREDDYRRHAAETMDLVQKAGSSFDKRRLLQLAERWLNLADRAHRTARENYYQGASAPAYPVQAR